MENCFDSLLYHYSDISIDDSLLFAEDVDTYLTKSMAYPTTAGQLHQFLCATNRVRDSIVDYARAVHPLQQRLDLVLKRVAAGISIQLSQSEREVFDHVKDRLLYPMPRHDLSDASDTGFAVLITQVISYDPKVPITRQQHNLLTCLSGTFSGAQLNWTVIEKEAYPIVVAYDKLDYLLLRARLFRLFCDHRNHIDVFAPHTSVKKHIKGKLLRWALQVMSCRYTIEHVGGVSQRLDRHVVAVGSSANHHYQVERTDTEERQNTANFNNGAGITSSTTARPTTGFTWPTLEEFRTVQRQDQAPTGDVRDKNDVLRVDQRLRVPRDCSDLTQRLGNRSRRG
ncbi:Hypothetical protein PHPALM_9056 [Phytophthora palmivora]|uniref:Reverse transcriptase RNase H-like domain-containing protein n=1 Tax=Phytophthora palmivora TaxID=4796 RepID=A0A2P4Y8A0_9STRA|nr:Hypothetical protein PHPALM_9056 [Phytophthora palmivora]